MCMTAMTAILFDGAKLFDQIINILSPEDPMWKLMKIVQELLEKKKFKDSTILHMYKTMGKGR